MRQNILSRTACATKAKNTGIGRAELLPTITDYVNQHDISVGEIRSINETSGRVENVARNVVQKRLSPTIKRASIISLNYVIISLMELLYAGLATKRYTEESETKHVFRDCQANFISQDPTPVFKAGFIS